MTSQLNQINRETDNTALPPTTDEIIRFRKAAELTQREAAELIHKKTRTWQNWESGDREMDPAFFELFLIKSNQMPK